MKVEVEPSGSREKLREHLERRFGLEIPEGGELEFEMEQPERLARVPGVERFSYGDDSFEGLGGSVVEERAVARLETEEDAARIFLATVAGYDVDVLHCDREWDLKALRGYNPSIKNLKGEAALKHVEAEVCINGKVGGKDAAGIEEPEDTLRSVYREYLT